MPYAMIPPGYRAVLLGQAQTIEDLGTFAPLEEGAAEGALVLMRLDFLELPSEETLGNLEQALRDRRFGTPVLSPGREASTTSMPILTHHQSILSGRKDSPGCR